MVTIAQVGDFRGRHTIRAEEWDDALAELRAEMDTTHYWPNLWSLSDHGNLCLLTMPDGEQANPEDEEYFGEPTEGDWVVQP